VHVRHIMEKLGAIDRTQALAIAARRGIIVI
jgi:DNA-binding CsgD family transcriptional regulator